MTVAPEVLARAAKAAVEAAQEAVVQVAAAAVAADDPASGKSQGPLKDMRKARQETEDHHADLRRFHR